MEHLALDSFPVASPAPAANSTTVRDRLVAGAEALAIRAARRWQKVAARVGLTCEELEQEARLHLLLAARAFLERAEHITVGDFQVYARKWIREAVRRSILRAGVVAAPRVEQRTAHHVALEDINPYHGSANTETECSHKGLGLDEVERVVEHLSSPPVEATRHDIDSILARLTPELRRLVVEHYGLGDSEPRTARYLAERSGLSEFQVRMRLATARKVMAQHGAGDDGVAALESLTRHLSQVSAAKPTALRPDVVRRRRAPHTPPQGAPCPAFV